MDIQDNENIEKSQGYLNTLKVDEKLLQVKLWKVNLLSP